MPLPFTVSMIARVPDNGILGQSRGYWANGGGGSMSGVIPLWIPSIVRFRRYIPSFDYTVDPAAWFHRWFHHRSGCRFRCWHEPAQVCWRSSDFLNKVILNNGLWTNQWILPLILSNITHITTSIWYTSNSKFSHDFNTSKSGFEIFKVPWFWV